MSTETFGTGEIHFALEMKTQTEKEGRKCQEQSSPLCANSRLMMIWDSLKQGGSKNQQSETQMAAVMLFIPTPEMCHGLATETHA